MTGPFTEADHEVLAIALAAEQGRDFERLPEFPATLLESYCKPFVWEQAARLLDAMAITRRAG